LKFLDKLIKTKDSNWSYEKEYRFLKHRKELVKDGHHFFHNFNKDELELRYVILGMRSAAHNDQKYKALLESYGYLDNVRLKRVERSYGEYSMTTHQHIVS